MSAMSLWVPTLIKAVAETAAGQFPSDAKGWELLDNNPDNSITSSSATTLTVRIDSGSSGHNFSGFWVTGGLPASGTLTIKSTADSSYATGLTTDWVIALNTISGNPFIVRDYVATVRRYCQFEFTSLPAAIELGMVFIGLKYDIATQWDWESIGTTRHVNTSAVTASGRVLSRNMVSAGQRIIQRRWEFLSASDATNIRTAFAYVRGSHVPFIITDAADNPEDSTGYLVRFADDQLDETEVANGLWNVQINLVEVPYITPGEIY